MFDGGAQYRTVNFARSAISKLHNGYDGLPAGQHPIVKQAVKAVFRLRPPLPKYKTTFNIKPVLTYVKQVLGNNNYLTLRLLSFKCLFLLSFSSISRVSTMARLGTQVEEHVEHIIVPILSLEKQARASNPARVRGFLRIPRFLEDLSLCPATTLAAYLEKVKH